MSDLTNQIKLQKMLSAMLGNKATVTQKDIDDIVAVNEGHVSDQEIIDADSVELRIRHNLLSEIKAKLNGLAFVLVITKSAIVSI